MICLINNYYKHATNYVLLHYKQLFVYSYTFQSWLSTYAD